MKKHIKFNIDKILALSLFIIFSTTSFSALAQFSWRKASFGVQIGSDIGGVVPVKERPKIANPYPNIRLSFGGRATYPIANNNWSIGLEVAYKAVSLDADARVDNQKFNDNGRIQYFTGVVETNMSFTFLEIPLYCTYRFRSGRDKILLGPYFAYNFKSRFTSDPKKGFIGASPDEVSSTISDDAKDPNYIESFDFSKSLSRNDLGVLFGYERAIGDKIGVGLRLSFGLKDTFRKDDHLFDYKMIQVRGSLVISYNLFQVKMR